MSQRVARTTRYVSGAARFKDLVYLIGRDRGLETREIEHTRFLAFDRGLLAHMGDRNWRAVAVCVVKAPTERMVAVGEDGQVFTYVGGTTTDEVIKPRPSALRNVRVVDGLAYACGMKRQVYKRVGENAWSPMHAPAPTDGANAGFEAIAGFGDKELYAVGWSGEIWKWDGSVWTSCTSPTNLILTGLCCGEDEQVYACGQHGTLIRGRHDQWERIELESMNEDLWDLIWHKGKLYLAAMTMLYVFKDGAHRPVNFGSDVPASFYRLTKAEGVLWSIGSDDVFALEGESWARID